LIDSARRTVWSPGITITGAAKSAGVAHFIYSSVASANRATGIQHFDGKYAVEKHLQASGVPYTIVAPVFFMGNLLQPWTLSRRWWDSWHPPTPPGLQVKTCMPQGAALGPFMSDSASKRHFGD
jgi:hypothetical protein